jgi:hypothetical protein
MSQGMVMRARERHRQEWGLDRAGVVFPRVEKGGFGTAEVDVTRGVSCMVSRSGKSKGGHESVFSFQFSVFSFQQKQIPYGDDRKKGNGKGEGKSKDTGKSA